MHASIQGQIELPDDPRGHFEGRYRADVRVQFYGMLGRCRSVDNVCTQFSRQLISGLEGVAIHGYLGQTFFDPSLAQHAYLNRSAPIGIFYGTPDFVPDDFFNHATTIGGFVCETDAIPERWVAICNQFDLVLVPSSFCRKAFVDSGVTSPVGITPHGLEPEYRPFPNRRPGKPFIFYNTLNTNAPERKGLPELLRCFSRAFSGREDVILKLRVNDSKHMQKFMANHPHSPQVIIEHVDNASTEAFATTYSDVHCTVHPSLGEGFGLIPMQSIACETPVIAPASTGMADYLNDENAMLVETCGPLEQTEIYYGTGAFTAIDEAHLVEQLRYAEANWAFERDRVRSVAEAFRQKHAWEAVLANTIALVRELSQLDDSDARRALIERNVSRLTTA